LRGDGLLAVRLLVLVRLLARCPLLLLLLLPLGLLGLLLMLGRTVRHSDHLVLEGLRWRLGLGSPWRSSSPLLLKRLLSQRLGQLLGLLLDGLLGGLLGHSCMLRGQGLAGICSSHSLSHSHSLSLSLSLSHCLSHSLSSGCSCWRLCCRSLRCRRGGALWHQVRGGVHRRHQVHPGGCWRCGPLGQLGQLLLEHLRDTEQRPH
jgi:hypothetical protein